MQELLAVLKSSPKLKIIMLQKDVICICVCVCVCMCVCVPICVHICIHIHICICTCIYVYVYVYVYTHIHMCIHAYIHIMYMGMYLENRVDSNTYWTSVPSPWNFTSLFETIVWGRPWIMTSSSKKRCVMWDASFMLL